MSYGHAGCTYVKPAVGRSTGANDLRVALYLSKFENMKSIEMLKKSHFNKLNFFLSAQFKNKNQNKNQNKKFKQATKNAGFTLIELMVATILAVLVITPLLGFMINILDTDRKEQAKINSEQEIQTALDYIAQDLQQAIYIYDADGINAIKSQLLYSSSTDRVPVLVFWKRKFEKDAVELDKVTTAKTKNDAFVYSLVTYYLIEDSDKNDKNDIWSNQYRIARFELSDGIEADEDYNTKGNSKKADPGFKLFDLNAQGTLEQKMNDWKKDDDEYSKNANADVLVDYIDSSQGLATIDCKSVFPKSKKDAASLRVPADEKIFNNASFYACVDIDNTTAQIFLRGNALARIEQKNNSYNNSLKSYFPTANIKVKGRGFIGVE